MFRYSLSWYLFTFTLLELIIKTHLIPHDSSHGFINKNSKYLEDDFKSIHEELSSGLRSAQMNDFNLNLRLEPSILDFKQRQLGIAHLEKVTLFNTDKNRSIDMTSISGSTAYFHSSFFESKKIPPNGNTTFNVVFLGREEGLVEGNLFIHSSDGYFKYNVKGATTYSRFRLRPIVGVKLPLNSTFSPLIYLYNPHPKPVQITEVYSSGGDFHLELPSGDQEGPNDLWEIPPYQTKAIIRVRFKAKVVQNHTAYVRIKLNSQSELLVVPLEVEVTPNGELVHPQGGIDFGIGGNLDPPKEVKLCVSNPMKKPVRVHSVTTTSKAIEVNFEPTRIPPDIGDKGGCTEIGTLTLNWKKAFDKNDFSGKILVKYRQGRNASVIPYYLTVLDGGLTFDPLQTSYFVEDAFADLTTRDFVIRNDFYSPVEIVQFEIHPDANKYFKVESFTPTILKPTNEKKIFRLRLRYGMNLSAVNLNSQIILKTNITDVVIPILSYKGKIKLYLPFKGPDDTLDIGLISYNTQKNVYFLIANPNPVSLVLKTIRSSIPMTNMELMGCKRGNYEEAILNVKHKNLTNCINVKPNHYAVIKLTVQTSGSEGQIWGDVYVETQYEQMSIPVHFRVAPGKLEIGPDRLVFDQCFPGKICSHPLRVHSTFREPMIIENIMSLPPDKRIYSKHSGHILAGTTKVVGHLYLNPNVECNNECYTGFVDDSTSQWLNTLSLDFAYDIDVYLLNVLYNRYLNETANGLRKWQNLTIRIDTSEVKGHIFKTRVKMSWPSLLINENVENRSLFVFPTTQIGNISYRNISLRNPSAHPLVVQLVLDKHYGNIAQLYKDIPPSFLPERSKEFQQYGFFFVDHKKYLKEFYGNVDWPCSEDSVPLLLGPGENITVTVGFRAEETNFISSMMVIRNNLTILEFLTVRGQGVHPQFKFGNRKPGSEQPLSFEMTERHLRDCEKDKQQINVTPNLTVKRSFTARNIGDVTIYVNSFYINDYPCEGYGFKVINCVPFALPPNGTRKIDIAFTPDLTLSKVMRTLILGTSLNFPVNYTLYTTIPAHYLHMCSELIMRPYWEIYMSYLINIFMILLLFVIVFLAVMDAERIKKQAFGELLANTTTSIQPVLDLRMVGQQAREEIRTLKVEKSDNNNSVEIKTAQKKEEKANNNNKLQLSNGVHKQKPKEEVLEQPKYHAMIPVTGKTKKKLGKRNSNDYSVDTPETVQKKSPDTFKPFKLKMEEKKPTSCTSTASVPPTKSVKPIVSNKKVNYTKNTNVPAVSEEETSSTTTECSSNDDPEKEKDQSNQKICSKKTADKQECVKQTVGEEVQEFEETNDVKQDVISQNNKVERQKLAPKTKTKPSKELHESTKTDSQGSKSNRESKKSKAQRERKEKLQLKKQSSDKNNTLTNGKTIESQARKSPQIPSKSIWGENCATFSDVVARTESLSTNRPLCQKPNFKPTMYVEPYQQTQTDLGPVGSRRLEYYGDAYLSHTNLESSNSFFSTNHEIRPENNVNYFEDLLQTDNWNQDFSSLGNQDVFSDPAVPFPMDDPWNHNLLDSNLYWQNNFGLTPQPEPVENSSTPNSIQEQMNYLWGSSPVWQPWTPAETPRTPTRTPPGFDEFVQPRSRNEMQYPPQPIQNQPQRESYSPFPTSTIWNPDPLNPWNYNQGQ